MSLTDYIGRVGRTLIAPRQAALGLCAGERGGVRDVVWLLPLRLLVGESALFLGDDPQALIVGILGALALDILAIFLGGVVMALLIGRRERLLRAGLTTDLMALGWFGWLAVQVAVALGCVAARYQPSAEAARVIQSVGFAVWAAYFAIGFFTARQAAVEAESTAAPPGASPSPAPAPVAPRLSGAPRWVGGVFVAALLALAIYDAAWLQRQHARRPGAGRLAPELVVRRLAPLPGALPGDDQPASEPFRLSAQRGHPVLIDFWATWCGPCKESLPILDKVYERLQPRGLRFLAVDTGEDEALVRAFALRMGLRLPLGLDGGEGAERYHVNSIPHLVLIGSDGGIKRVFHGVHSAEEIERAVLTLGF